MGAVIFMLRVLAAFLREKMGISPRVPDVHVARVRPIKQRGELISMNSKNNARASGQGPLSGRKLTIGAAMGDAARLAGTCREDEDQHKTFDKLARDSSA